MNRRLFTIACLLGAAGVVAGALGAHALRERLEPQQLDSFNTAVRYQVWHALALLVVASQAAALGRWGRRAGWALLIGALLFSGSIYALVLIEPRPRFLGPVTPLGGLCMIVGWLMLARAGCCADSQSSEGSD